MYFIHTVPVNTYNNSALQKMVLLKILCFFLLRRKILSAFPGLAYYVKVLHSCVVFVRRELLLWKSQQLNMAQLCTFPESLCLLFTI